MKRSRFTEEQIIGVSKEQELGTPGGDLCRKHGISQQTFYNWKSKYAGMNVSEARRLKERETENGKLKKLLADAMVDNAALKGISGTAPSPVVREIPKADATAVTANWRWLAVA